LLLPPYGQLIQIFFSGSIQSLEGEEDHSFEQEQDEEENWDEEEDWEDGDEEEEFEGDSQPSLEKKFRKDLFDDDPEEQKGELNNR